MSPAAPLSFNTLCQIVSFSSRVQSTAASSLEHAALDFAVRLEAIGCDGGSLRSHRSSQIDS
jgi:hypothetical protein